MLNIFFFIVNSANTNRSLHFTNFLSRDYKILFILNSNEHEVSTGHKTKMLKKKDIFCFKTVQCGVYPANKCENANSCWHFHIYVGDNCPAQLS